MPRRIEPTWLDYVVVALNPLLIMTMLGSLVFFILATCYQGEYPDRLRFIFSMYVMGAVLTTRISMEEGTDYATLFGAPLAAVTLLAVARFVEVPNTIAGFAWLVHIGLLALVWWSAHQLTWDCTLLDESAMDEIADATGQGLLQFAGLTLGENWEPSDRTPGKPASNNIAEDAPRTTRQGWWQRWIESRRRPHAHGMWVVYFFLAAIPLFGIGHGWIPATDSGTQRSVFRLLAVYLVSAGGLLMTTSLLGLRRYARHRQLEMPDSMAGRWLGTGAAIVAVIGVLGLVLPWPNSGETLLSRAVAVTSPEGLSASRMSLGQEGDHEADSAEHATAPDDTDADEQRDAVGEREDGETDDAQDGQSDKPSGAGHDQQSSPDSSSQTTEQSSTSEQPPESEQAPASEPPPQAPVPSEPPPGPPEILSQLTGLLQSLQQMLRWLLIAATVVVGVLFAYWNRDVIAAMLGRLFEALRQLWHRLWGGEVPPLPAESPAAAVSIKRPFGDYLEPFSTNQFRGWPVERLVVYSFEAMQAWADERGCGRVPDQTVQEFSIQIRQQHAYLADPVMRLANLYSQVAYDPGSPLPKDARQQVLTLWRCLTEPSA